MSYIDQKVHILGDILHLIGYKCINECAIYTRYEPNKSANRLNPVTNNDGNLLQTQHIPK